jgi:hypothetical protein
MSKLFSKETDLCAAFLEEVARREKGWVAYNETCGFDIVLVRASDGAQIGIEAKLALNPTVLCQALEGVSSSWRVDGPDYRAVLVPADATKGLAPICAALGVTVLSCGKPVPRTQRSRGGHWSSIFSPSLPDEKHELGAKDWHEWCPERRLPLPEYVPDVVAGAPAPVALTQWKIQAIKLAILLAERPVTRADFKALRLSPSRWTDPYTGWLVKGEGGYVAGAHIPDFKAQHPTAWEQILADKEKWAPPARPEPGKTGAML